MKTLPFLLLLFFVANTIYAQDKKPSDYSIAALDSILEVYKATGAYAEIFPYAQAGVDKATQELGKQDTTYARMLYFLGFGHHIKREHDKAIFYYKKAIDIQKIKIPKHPKYAQSLNNLGILYLSLGNYTLTESLYKEALKIRKESLGVRHPDYAGSLDNLAILYKAIGKHDLAEPLHIESVKLYKELVGDKHPEYAGSLINLANLYHAMGNDALAESLYKETLVLCKEVLGKKHRYYRMALHNLTNIYVSSNQLDLAEALCQELFMLSKETSSVKDFGYIEVLQNLTTVYTKQGKYALSESLNKESLILTKEAFGEKHPYYAMNLHTLASLYIKTKQYSLAEPLYKEAAAILTEVHGTKHENYISGFNDLAAVNKLMGNYAISWDYLQQAISTNSCLPISLHVSKAWADSLLKSNLISTNCILITLLHFYELLEISPNKTNKEHPEASSGTSQVIVAELALSILKQNRDGFINEADKLRVLSQSNDWVLRILSVLSKTPNLLGEDKNTQVDKAFTFAEQSKSVLLMDAAKTEQAHNFGDLPDSLIQQELSLQKKHSEYEAGLAENRPESEKNSLRTQLNKLNSDILNFKKNIEKNYPKYAALKYKQQDAKAKEIQALLDDKTALLEYVMSDSLVYIFYVDNKNLNLLEHVVSKKALAEKIKLLHRALSDYTFISKENTEAYRIYTENAHWFYKNLVAPALSNAKNIEHLIIITDGELGFLPFETFLVEQAPQKVENYANLHYLLNDYHISYNYSATLWKQNQDSPPNKNNGHILAMASNYTILLDASKKDLRLPVYERLRKILPPLPEAEKEVKVLEETFQGYFGLDKFASEKNFKEKAGAYSIIHLAMHGLLNEKSPILSCLAFTEDGDSLENNFLHAYEISKLKLNADLVVLSACETGYGKFEKGNGVASLARAFMYAGASSLVVSLWQVNDYSTAEIMKFFYANLANGMDKAKALQQAKLEYIKKANGIAAHPAFWSAFIQLGDSRPIRVETQFIVSKTLWAIAIALLILGSSIAIFRRKRTK